MEVWASAEDAAGVMDGGYSRSVLRNMWKNSPFCN